MTVQEEFGRVSRALCGDTERILASIDVERRMISERSLRLDQLERLASTVGAR